MAKATTLDAESELKVFRAGDPIHVRAQQVWIILIHRAAVRGVITYGELAELMGYGRQAAQATIKPIAIVAFFCKEHHLPQLNTLVVNTEKGEPGRSVVDGGDSIGVAHQRVFAFDWFGIRVPTPGTFRKVWEDFS